MKRSQRTFLAFVTITVFVVVSVWLGLEIERVNRQRRAREMLRGRGWVVLYEYQHDADYWLANNPPPGPAWMRRVVGDDLFANVTYVTTRRGNVSESDLYSLASFTALRHLDLGADATDDVLARLRPMQELDWLNLRQGKIRDLGLEYLVGLTRLRVLKLEDTEISDAGLIHLAKLHELESLDLCGTRVTDAGLSHLHTLSRLWTLDLDRTAVSDQGIAQLKELRRLAILSVMDTRVTEDGIRRLKEVLPALLVSK